MCARFCKQCACVRVCNHVCVFVVVCAPLFTHPNLITVCSLLNLATPCCTHAMPVFFNPCFPCVLPFLNPQPNLAQHTNGGTAPQPPSQPGARPATSASQPSTAASPAAPEAAPTMGPEAAGAHIAREGAPTARLAAAAGAHQAREGAPTAKLAAAAAAHTAGEGAPTAKLAAAAHTASEAASLVAKVASLPPPALEAAAAPSQASHPQAHQPCMRTQPASWHTQHDATALCKTLLQIEKDLPRTLAAQVCG